MASCSQCQTDHRREINACAGLQGLIDALPTARDLLHNMEHVDGHVKTHTTAMTSTECGWRPTPIEAHR